MQDCSDAKKPCKGILKTSSSFDRPGASYRKSAKFDELNVLQTYHPPDKDYGHMKIEEPKTPFNYINADEMPEQLDADLLAEKLRIAANTQTPSFGADELSDDEFPETDQEKIHRMEFERRRKAHYNEFEAVKIARKLIEEELDEESGDELNADTTGMSVSSVGGGAIQKSDGNKGEQSIEDETIDGGAQGNDGEKAESGSIKSGKRSRTREDCDKMEISPSERN